MTINFICNQIHQLENTFSQTIIPAIEKTAQKTYHFIIDFFILFAKRMFSSVYYFIVYKIPFDLSIPTYAFESLFTEVLIQTPNLSKEELEKGSAHNQMVLKNVQETPSCGKRILLLIGLIAKLFSEIFFDSSQDFRQIWMTWMKMAIATTLSLVCLSTFIEIGLYFTVLNILYFCYLILLISGIYLIQNTSYFNPISSYNTQATLQEFLDNLCIKPFQFLVDCKNCLI
jgi:hypothetical protein